MEFGVVGFDGFSSDNTTKQKCCGSIGNLELQKTVTFDVSLDFKASKIAKLSNDSQQEHNMMSFSSPKLENNNLHNSSAFAYFQHPSQSYSNNAGGLNGKKCLLNGVKWPFTTSQWLELEQQALIYKYIIANKPIPSNLLIPIQRALELSGFCSFPGGLLRPNAYGWGPFHLGFSNSNDPEPGRCRRTDGKKWRCSREAVLDQKYCERHMNRGRHRSRKPVEGAPSGNSLSRPTTNKTNCLAHLRTNPNPSSSLPTSNSMSAPVVSRNSTGLHFLSPKISLDSIVKDQQYAEQASEGFRFDTSDHAHLTSTPRTPSLYGSYSSHDSNPVRPFMDDQSDILLPKMQAQPERTQLSISIPSAPADFRSSTSSPTGEKVILSPLRLSREIDPLEMGLGRGKQLDLDPVSWETSIGGPLGEVLKPTSNNTYDKNLSDLSLLSKGWECSLQSTLSPTGVLRRNAPSSLSNSSAGSSPRPDTVKAHESGRMLWK